MNDRVREIIKKAVTGLVITLIIIIAMWAYYGNVYTWYIALIGAIVTIITSQAYLLPFSTMKIEGTVRKSTVKTFRDMAVLGSRKRGTTHLRVVVSGRTIQGRWFKKSFEFNGEQDNIPIGTRIRFTIFDKRPIIV